MPAFNLNLVLKLSAAAFLLSLSPGPSFAADPAHKVPRGRDVPVGFRAFYDNREKPRALLDHPLRDPSITRGPDGVYYLTGTDGTPAVPSADKPVDFDNNDGIRVWKSTDLETWELVGKVFDLVGYPKGASHDVPWWRYPTVRPETPFGPLVRGATAPEIHYLKNNFYIVFSIGGQGVGILKSKSGSAAGPYELLAPAYEGLKGMAHNRVRPIVHEGGSASLFADDDGTVHLLYGRGLIAPLKDDLTALAAPPRQLNVATAALSPGNSPHLGQSGYHLFKHEGRYWLTARNLSYRDQYAASDVFVASADTLHGPYSERRWMIPHAGETTIFRGPAGELLATFSGGDEESALRDRAGIVPLRWEDTPRHLEKIKSKFPRLAAGVHTERGAWEQLSPIASLQMRDVQCMRAPDGWYYYTGSWNDPAHSGRLPLLRSRDLVNWEEFTVLKLEDLPMLTAASVEHRRALGAKSQGRSLADKFMDCELHYVKGTFYYIFALYDPKAVGGSDLGPPETGKFHHGVFYMRSTSGKIEGPWEQLGRFPGSQGNLFEDADGTVYAATGRYGLGKMKPDMSGRDGDNWNALPADGSHAFTDVGVTLTKIKGRYVYFSCGYANGWWHEPAPALHEDAISSYNYSYMTAPAPTGPWSRARMAVDYGGHGGVFQDDKGRWWAAFFACEGSQDLIRHWWALPGVVPLDVFERDGELIIRVADKLPEDYAAALAKKRAQLK